jgi:hypothetical protein
LMIGKIESFAVLNPVALQNALDCLFRIHARLREAVSIACFALYYDYGRSFRARLQIFK